MKKKIDTKTLQATKGGTFWCAPAPCAPAPCAPRGGCKSGC